jgi:DNA invertase Pin-like site-specific DNA recombinase
VNDLKARGIAFRSLTEQMDTTTPQGEFLFHVFGALAQFECRFRRNPPGHSDLMPPTIPT